MYQDFLGPRGLQGTHMDTLKPKNSKSMTFNGREGFFTFWEILAHSLTVGRTSTITTSHFYAMLAILEFQAIKAI